MKQGEFVMDFVRLSDLLDQAEQKWHVPACECVVYIDHHKVFYHSAGFSDAKRTAPAGPGDTYFIYSFTKLFTMTLTMRLIEKGFLSLTDPVEKYLPAWMSAAVRQGERVIPSPVKPTVFHLMTMTAGLNYSLSAAPIQELLARSPETVTLRMLADRLAEAPLDFIPGERFQYSLCHDLLGAVLESATGRTFSDLMRENLFEPLGMTTTTFFPTTAHLQAMSQPYQYDASTDSLLCLEKTNPFVFSPGFASGGAGLVSVSSELILLCDALACGGVTSSGERILSEESLRRMTKDHMTPAQKMAFNHMKPHPYSYGLGVRTLTADTGKARAGEFGWDGAAGAYNLMDRERRLSLVYTQHILDHGMSFSEIHPLLRDLIYEIVET